MDDDLRVEDQVLAHDLSDMSAWHYYLTVQLMERLRRRGRLFGTVGGIEPMAAEEGEGCLRQCPCMRWVRGILTAKPMRPKSPTGSVMMAVVVWERIDGWDELEWRGRFAATGRATQEGNWGCEAGDGQEEGRRSLVGVL